MNYEHIYKPGEPGHPTFLVLHGTGGTEKDLVPLVNYIDSKAGILSVRGDVLENGMNRFFRRLAEGIFDKEDLEKRTHMLYDFLQSASENYKFDKTNVIALGYSNGALIGAWFGVKYPKIKRLALVNGPLMYNFHKTKEGALSFNGDMISFIYGEYDQSIGYIDLLKNMENDKIKVFVEKGQDHHFSKSEESFQEIPEKYLFEIDNKR